MTVALQEPSKGMLQPQKNCTHFMTFMENLSKRILLTALRIALSFNRYKTISNFEFRTKAIL